jgi:adenylate cyclase
MGKKGLSRTKITSFVTFASIVPIILINLIIFQSPLGRLVQGVELDFLFRSRPRQQAELIQEGVVQQTRNVQIHPEILLLGVDSRTLNRFGRWPFPRFRHADLLNTLTRIRNQSLRESAVLLDFFFIDATDDPVSDALLRDAIFQNDRLFLETIPSVDPFTQEIQQSMELRFRVLQTIQSSITQVHGDWKNIPAYLAMESPLIPFVTGAGGYGHAIFQADVDGSFRRQPLIVKLSNEIEVFSLNEISRNSSLIDTRRLESFQRFGYLDSLSYSQTIPETVLSNPRNLESYLTRNSVPRTTIDSNGNEQQEFFVRLYQDYFIPAITLRLAAHHLHVPLENIQVRLGEYVLIPNPQMRDVDGSLVPYELQTSLPVFNQDGEMIQPGTRTILPEIRIPIDDFGQMLINYMGPRSTEDSSGFQTFPVRSFSAYAGIATGPLFETWPESLFLENKIIMAGAFTPGMADDEKLTPFGLMYGVEVHANALNTILTSNFIQVSSIGFQLLILAGLILVSALFTGFLKIYLGLMLSTVLIIGYIFIQVFLIFPTYNLVFPLILPTVSIITMIIISIGLRVLLEEKDKRQIRSTFGKYVSPGVVDQILKQPPELGGVDKEITVFFSDIRGFTGLSETMTPQELVAHLNIYLTAMTDIILEFEGTLDKYVGDEIMCFWGAPLTQKDHALLACKCALKQMEKLRELNTQWPQEKRLDIGIGINSGIMTVGNMGSMGRMNYTLMGDNVNLAARLEGTNKAYLTNIIISEYTFGLVKDHVVARELDVIRVKGKNKPVVIYELLDLI